MQKNAPIGEPGVMPRDLRGPPNAAAKGKYARQSVGKRREKDEEGKAEARGHASRRAVRRATGKDLYRDNVQDFRVTLAVSGQDNASHKSQEQPAPAVVLPGLERTIKRSFRGYELANKYVSQNYVGNDFEKAVEGSASPQDGPLAGYRWVYSMTLEDVHDERLDDVVDTRSSCLTVLRGELVAAVPDLDTPVRINVGFKEFEMPFDGYQLEQFGINMSITALALAALYLAFLFDLQGFCYAVIVAAFALALRSRRKPRNEFRGGDWAVSLAHLAYGKRQGIDGSSTLVKNKLRDTHLYPANLAMLLQNYAIRDYVLSVYLRSGVVVGFRRHETKPALSKLDPEQPVGKMKLRDPNLRVVDRAYVGMEDPTCDPDKVSIGIIDKDSLMCAAQSRIWKRPKPARSRTEYEFMLGIAKQYAGRNELGEALPEMLHSEFARVLAERKSLTMKERERLFATAAELDDMSDDQVVAALNNALKRTSWFIKNEGTPYNKKLVHRFIINPDLLVKLIFGAALHPVEDYIYNNDRLRPHLIKHKKPEEIADDLISRFEPSGFYLNTDYSRFECSIRKDELDMEFDLYDSFVDRNGLSKRVFDAVRAYQLEDNKVLRGAKGTLSVPDIRLSGFPNTSLGNVIQNLCNVKLAESRAGVVLTDFMLEGDDGILRFPTAESRSAFLRAIKEQRFLCESDSFSRGTDVGFCGLSIKDGVIVPTEHQWNKLHVILSEAELSDSALLSRLLARYVGYYFKYPSVREQLRLKTQMLLREHPEVASVHTRKVRAAFRDDWYQNQDVDDDEFYEGLKSLLAGPAARM